MSTPADTAEVAPPIRAVTATMLATMRPVSVSHYENFPVASVLCPPDLRPAVRAIYWFARTADDIADEGTATPTERLDQLRKFRAALHACADGGRTSAWQEVFTPLSHAIRTHALPVPLLDDLLDAFMQDCVNPRYDDRAQLLDYCRRSAQPIGRLLLHLYGIGDGGSLAQSDAICSALQLINFWQDASVDLPRGRNYVPASDARRHGLERDELSTGQDSPATRALIRELCTWAGELMHKGAPLALRLPGRVGWELRLVVLGGQRILEKIAAMEHATLSHRPVVGTADVPILLWRALNMRRDLRASAVAPR